MMFGCGASVLAHVVFLASLSKVSSSKARLQDCMPEGRQIISSRDKDDVVFKAGAYDFSGDLSYILLYQNARRSRYMLDIRVRDEKSAVNLRYDDVSVDIQFKRPRHFDSITATLHDVSESASGDYVLFDSWGPTTLQCWRLYCLGDKRAMDDYLEDGTVLQLSNFPSLSKDTTDRMNVTTRWLVADREIDAGQQPLVERSMDRQNLTYLIQELSNRTITFFISTLKVSYIDSIVFDPPQDTYILAAKEALPPIRCYGNCSPGCNIAWYRGTMIVSDTDVLSYPVDGQTEFLCYATNPHTGKQLNRKLQVSRMGVISVALDPKETIYMLKPGEKIPDIRCTAQCLSTCRIIWSKNGAKITDAHVLTSRSSDASGEYTCLVHDAATETNQTKSIFILYEGVVSVAFDPKDTFYMLKPGEKIPDIQCTAECLSTCRIAWSKDGAKITDTHVLTSRSSDASGEYTCLVYDTATETNQTKSIFILYEEETSQIAVYLLGTLVGVLSVTSLALATYLWRHVTCPKPWTLRKKGENDEGNVEMAGVTEQYEDLQDPGNTYNMYDRINPEGPGTNRQTVTETYENMAMT